MTRDLHEAFTPTHHNKKRYIGKTLMMPEDATKRMRKISDDWREAIRKSSGNTQKLDKEAEEYGVLTKSSLAKLLEEHRIKMQEAMEEEKQSIEQCLETRMDMTADQFLEQAIKANEKGRALAQDLFKIAEKARIAGVELSVHARQTLKLYQEQTIHLGRCRYALEFKKPELVFFFGVEDPNMPLGKAYVSALGKILDQGMHPSGEDTTKQLTKSLDRKRDDDLHAEWANKMIRHYEDIPSDEKFRRSSISLWCPITSPHAGVGPHPGNYLKAAHIVPWSFGAYEIAWLFGEEPQKGFQLMWEVGNGIFMHPDVEKAFDRYSWVINLEGPDDYRVRVIDRTILETDFMLSGTVKMTWAQLDGTKLEFRGSGRPGTKFLFAHLLFALIVRRRRLCVDYKEDQGKTFDRGDWKIDDLESPRAATLRVVAREVLGVDLMDDGAVLGVFGLNKVFENAPITKKDEEFGHLIAQNLLATQQTDEDEEMEW